MTNRLLLAIILLSSSLAALGQYALQVQGGRAFHGHGDFAGRDLRVAASHRLILGTDLRLAYHNAAYAGAVGNAVLRERGGRDGDPLHIGDQGIALGAFDQYVQTSAILVGLARDTRLYKPLYLYTALAGGVHRERRKTLASAQYQFDGQEVRLTDVDYGLSSFRTGILSVDLGLLYKFRGLTVGPYVSAQFGGVGTTGAGLLLRVDWPCGEKEGR